MASHKNHPKITKSHFGGLKNGLLSAYIIIREMG